MKYINGKEIPENLYDLIPGYKVEPLYSYNWTRVFYLIKEKHLKEDVHKKIREQKKLELCQILKEKRKEECRDLWSAMITWHLFHADKWLKKNNIKYKTKPTGLENSFIVRKSIPSFYLKGGYSYEKINDNEFIKDIKHQICKKRAGKVNIFHKGKYNIVKIVEDIISYFILNKKQELELKMKEQEGLVKMKFLVDKDGTVNFNKKFKEFADIWYKDKMVLDLGNYVVLKNHERDVNEDLIEHQLSKDYV